jgi:formiminoglutamase
MENYTPANPQLWSGRPSEDQQYVHEKVVAVNLREETAPLSKKSFSILGYACDEGVARNRGRVGAYHGPDHIKKALGPMPNHLPQKYQLFDLGNIVCIGDDLEGAQKSLSETVGLILSQKSFPIVLGGGHDMAYGHFKGIRNHFGPSKKIGIINFDAHFDLRDNGGVPTSGTPFHQIATEAQTNGEDFNYLCLGIRRDANPKVLFETAQQTGSKFILRPEFTLGNLKKVNKKLQKFLDKVDLVYVTLDLDGFASAYAPGVSAPSPLGFNPEIVLECLNTIIASKKLTALDLAEYNPTYDIDGITAKLAASLIHYCMYGLMQK